MKTFTSYFLALLLTLSAIAVDAQLVSELSRLQNGHALTEDTRQYDFVLVGTEQVRESTVQLKTQRQKPVSTPQPSLLAVHLQLLVAKTVPRSNVAFMSRKNCVSIPLRL